MSELIPPLVLELRARATEAVAGMKEARAESSKTAAAFEADAAKMEAEINRALAREREAALQAGESFDEMARRQALAIDKAAGVTARDTKEIDSALARERTAAAETGAAFEESARRQQLAAERSTKAQTAAAEEGSHAGSIAKTALLGAAGAAAFVGFESIKAASSFDAATNVLVTAAGESEKNLGTIRQGIIRIAQETGTSTEQLTEGMYQIEKAGIRGADGLKILDAASKGAKEENADLSTVTNAMTSVMASYGASVGTPVQVMNALKTAAGESKTTMEEFAGALSTVVPIASASHISFDQVGGAIATLTSHGTSAREATQELASTIRNLQAPNNVAVNAMQQLGINVQDVTTHLGQRGLTGTIKLVTDAIAAKMGPQGLVIVDTMKKSATATADLQTMLGKMPPALAASAKAFMSGSMSQKEFKKS
ncbi:MAG: phage tail tape measure protein, partial [Actinomycetes bacterium]